MAITIIKQAGGTTEKLASHVGVERQIFIDTTKKTVVVMDGATPGGFPLAHEAHEHDASSITSGVFDIARIPQAALERLVIVPDAPARLALTIEQIQNGEIVQEEDTQLMFYVYDDTHLGGATPEEAFRAFSAGTASAVAWSNIQDKPDFVQGISNDPDNLLNIGTDGRVFLPQDLGVL